MQVVYALGVPVVFLYRLNMFKEVLRAPAPQLQLGFLYRDYEQPYWCVWLSVGHGPAAATTSIVPARPPPTPSLSLDHTHARAAPPGSGK